MAGCVVFTTTYSMIVPAITIDQSTAEEMPGIFVEDVEGPEGYYEEAAVEEEAAPSEEVTEEQAEPENDSAAGTDLGNEAVADEQNEEAEAAYTEPEYSDEEDEAFYTDEETDDAAVYADEQDAVTDEQTADEQTIEEQVVTESEEAPVIEHQFASELTYEGGDYTVTASFDTPIEYRDTLELTATEMTAPDFENEYNAYYNETVARMLEREIDGIVDARYFRFRVYADGQDIAPAGGVTFTLTYQNSTEYLYGEAPYAIGFRAGDERQQDLYNADALSVEGGDSWYAYGYTFRVDGWDYSTIGAFRSAAPAESDETEDVVEETISEDVDTTSATESAVELVDDESAAVSVAEPTAEEEKLEGRLKFVGDGYKVFADITKEAGLPLDTELKVEEILPGDAQYEELLAQAAAATDENKNVAFARFFDISFMAADEEKEPTAGVSVKIEYSSPEKEEIKEATGVEVAAAPEAGDVSVMHFGEDGLNEVEANAVEKRGRTTVEFESDAFSVFGIVYTVDFETVDGGVYSIPGEGSYKLNDLLPYIIGKEGDVSDADLDVIEGEDVEGALYLTQDENEDWYINSDVSFTSTYLLTMTVDGVKYTVRVTDPPEEPGNHNNVWELYGSTSSFNVTTQSQTSDIDRNSSLDLDFSFTIKQDVLQAMKDFLKKPGPGHDEVVLQYDFSSAITDNGQSTGSVQNVRNASLMSGNRQIGTYSIVDGKLTMTITSKNWLLGRTNLTGSFGMSLAIDEEFASDKDNWEFPFPGAGNIDVTYKKKVEEGSKSVSYTKNDDGTYTMHYTASVKVNETLDSIQFNDTYSSDQTLSGKVYVNGKEVTITPTANGFTISDSNFKNAINSNDGVPTGTYNVTYETKIPNHIVETLPNPAYSTETNTASWTVDGNKQVPGGSTEERIPYETPPVPTPPFEKSSDPASGVTISNAGQEITYVIEVGSSEFSLAGLQVTDSMTDLQTLNGGKVYIAYGSPNGSRTEMPSGSVKWNNDDNYSTNSSQVFDYTFPQNSGNGPAYIIYTTTVINQETATAKGIYGTQTVANNANLVNHNIWKSTQHPVPFKEQEKVSVTKAASASSTNPETNNWVAGSKVSYTLTIGTVVSGDESASTTLSNMHIWDSINDIQKLDPNSIVLTITHPNGTTSRITNVVKDGQTIPVSQAVGDTAVDNNYNPNNTIRAFEFDLPSDAGSGQLTITYNTTLPDIETAAAQGIYDLVSVSNTGGGGNGQDETKGTGEFGPSPKMEIDKTVDNVKQEEKEPGSTVSYKVTYGYDQDKKLDGVIIKDEMTDIQKLVLKEDGSTIRITVNNRPESDLVDNNGNKVLTLAEWDAGTRYYYMPQATSQWNEDGFAWPYFDDDSYSTNSNVRVFWYKLPTGIGNNTVTVEFEAELISQDDANNNSISGSTHAYNTASADNVSDMTDVIIPFEEEVLHNPKIEKELDHWDADNNKIYWKLKVSKQDDSAYPLTNVTVGEYRGADNYTSYDGTTTYYQPISFGWVEGYSGHSISGNNLSFSLFDVAHAVITTDTGVELQPGVDYTIDKANASFHFDQLDTGIEILLAFDTPVDPSTKQQVNIQTGANMYNLATVDADGKKDIDDETVSFTNKEIKATKNSSYDSDTRVITYTVFLNPDCLEVIPNQDVIRFVDNMDAGVTLLNWRTGETENPSVYVSVHHKENGVTNFSYAIGAKEFSVTPDNGEITVDNIAVIAGTSNQDEELVYGQPTKLSKLCYKVQYKVSVVDDWAAVTSSETGYKDYENTATFHAGDKDYSGHTTTRVEGDEYVEKFDTTTEKDGFVFDEDKNQNSNVITYQVDINKNREQLNSVDHPYLELTDRIDTNMELNTDSVKFVLVSTDDPSVKTDITDSLKISYNDNTRILSVRDIPDKAYVVMTFSATSRTQGTDTYKNTVTVIGRGSHSASVSKPHNISTSYASLGGGELLVNLHKIDENNITKNIEGAEFKLYKCDLHLGDLSENSELLTRLMKDWEDDNYFTDSTKDYSYIFESFEIDNYTEVNNTEAVIDSTHVDGKVYVTDRDGFINGWDGMLNNMTVYCWEEVYAPEGYSGVLNDKHYFVVYPEKDKMAYAGYTWDNCQSWAKTQDEYFAQSIAWAIDNAVSMSNQNEDGSGANIIIASMASGMTWTATNISSDHTHITATKEWQDDSDNLFDTRPTSGIKLQLYRSKQDGSEKTAIGSAIPINADPVTGEWPSYTWSNLDKYYAEYDETGSEVQVEYIYTVEERPVAEYTTTYENNGINSGEITVINKLIPKTTDITVRKVFNPDGDNKPEQILVDLYSINTPLGGEPETPQYTGRNVALSESNNWTYTFTKLPTRSETGYLTYTMVERTVSGFNYTIVYSDKGEGVSEGEIVITNTLPGDLVIKKNVTLNNEPTDTTAVDGTYTFDVKNSDGEIVAEGVTINISNGVSNTAEVKDLIPGEYTVTEREPAEDDITLTSNNNLVVTVKPGVTSNDEDVETAEFTNNKDAPTGELNIKKTGTVNDVTDSNGLVNGTYIFRVEGLTGTTTEGNTVVVKITLENGIAKAVEKDGTSIPEDVEVTITNGVVTVSGLPTGDYNVTEDTTGLAAKGISVIGDNPQTINVQKDPETIPTAEFKNNKEVVNLKVSKKVDNRTSTDTSNQEFSFGVTLTAPSGVTFDSSYPTVKTLSGTTALGSQDITNGTEINVTLKGGDTWQINNLPKGTSYSITENIGTLPAGWTLTSTPNPKTGTISTAGITEELEFTNVYSEIKKAPEVTKELKGREWKSDEEFTFTLEADSSDTPTTAAIAAGKVVMPTTVTSKATASNKTAVFGEITFKDEGTYYFTIIETPGTEAVNGLKYSQKKVIVKVIVTKTAGVLSATMTYAEAKNDAGTEGSGELTYAETVQQFTNTYDTSTTALIKGTKELTGATDNKPVNNQFEFRLVADSSTPMPDGAEDGTDDYAGKKVTTVWNNAEGNFEFAAITYPLSVMSNGNGGYLSSKDITYKVSEVVPAPDVTDAEKNAKFAIRNGIMYDLSEKEVTVTVRYDASTGDLSATVNPSQSALKFTNEQLKDFEFGKEWHDPTDSTTTWPDGKEITVTVRRKIGQDKVDTGYAITYTINKSDLEKDREIVGKNPNDPKLVVTDATTYKFKLSNLQFSGTIGDAANQTAGEYTYYVTEEPVEGYYDPQYKLGETTTLDGAHNGGVIINRPMNTVKLPNTGGIGTTPYTIAGSLLMAFTALAYIFKKRRMTLVPVSDYDHSQRPRDRK